MIYFNQNQRQHQYDNNCKENVYFLWFNTLVIHTINVPH